MPLRLAFLSCAFFLFFSSPLFDRFSFLIPLQELKLSIFFYHFYISSFLFFFFTNQILSYYKLTEMRAGFWQRGGRGRRVVALLFALASVPCSVNPSLFFFSKKKPPDIPLKKKNTKVLPLLFCLFTLFNHHLHFIVFVLSCFFSLLSTVFWYARVYFTDAALSEYSLSLPPFFDLVCCSLFSFNLSIINFVGDAVYDRSLCFFHFVLLFLHLTRVVLQYYNYLRFFFSFFFFYWGFLPLRLVACF